MLTHFGTLFAMWHIYHYLTHLTHRCFTWNVTHCVQSHNHTNIQPHKRTLFHVEHKQTIQMFHVEQRNMSLTIFNKEIFKNIWNISKKLVSLQVLIKT